MNTQLSFNNVSLNTIPRDNQTWLSSSDIAKALNYSSSKSITTIFNRNEDEFSQGMSQVIKLTTSGNYQKTVRIFSLRGAHLIAMFARTEIAKEFRKWVLDILDKEAGNSAPARISSTPTQEEIDTYNINTLLNHFNVIYEVWKYQVEPAFSKLESPILGRLHDRFTDGLVFANYIKKSLNGRLTVGQRPRIY